MIIIDPQYPVVDLFAGPGGLGDGFSELSNKNNKPSFKVVAAIERDESARQTLTLRHFYRSFEKGNVPDEYYDYLAGKLSKEELQKKYNRQWVHAESTALNISLGEDSHDDVKKVIKQRLNKARKWALIGGPPCQAYSLVGRSRMMGNPEFEADERHFLYKEYLKIIIDHCPPVFLMENVKGLLSASVNGYRVIDKIVRDLSSPIRAIRKNQNGLKYRLYSLSQSGEIKGDVDPKSFIVKAEEFGVPQARHRMFILGIRDDIDMQPSILQKKMPPTVEQIIGTMPSIRSGVSRQKDSGELWRKIITSTYWADWLPSANVTERMVKKAIKTAIKEVRGSDLERASKLYRPPHSMRTWYYDERLKTVTSHEARSHMESDLYRYLFVSSYGQALNISPKLVDFPSEILPAHKNVKEGCAGKMFSDRFRVQIKSRVSTTVTSHISKDGHYFIHYDPAQCRSLTVREAARLQTFPDNFHFEGNRTSQYHQVGNAIPPYLATQIAEVVKEVLDGMPED